MKRFALSSAGVAAVALAGVASNASADLLYLDSQAYSGFGTNGHTMSAYMADATIIAVSGSMTSLAYSAYMRIAGSSTSANDLAIYAIDGSSNVVAQLGGWTNLFGVSNFVSTSQSGPFAAGSIVFSSAVNMDGGFLMIGNGYYWGGETTWDFEVTAAGLTQVPAPGALALIGVAGLASRRRRA